MWGIIFTKVSFIFILLILFLFISLNLIFLCYYCSIDLKRQSEHSGLHLKTSSLVRFWCRKKRNFFVKTFPKSAQYEAKDRENRRFKKAWTFFFGQPNFPSLLEASKKVPKVYQNFLTPPLVWMAVKTPKLVLYPNGKGQNFECASFRNILHLIWNYLADKCLTLVRN